MNKLLKELVRRKMFRTGIAYLAVGWVMLQVSNVVANALKLPDWTDTFVLFALLIGFPIVLITVWSMGAPEEDDAETNGEKDSESKCGQAVAGPGSERRPPNSIVILPFNNMLGDPDLDYLVDGVSEDITTKFARLPAIMSHVAGRNSAFAYKGKSPDLRGVGRELNVRYALEGSLRKMGDTVRVTAQLINTETGAHIWSDNYDYPLEDLLRSSDQVVYDIASVAARAVMHDELARVQKFSPDEASVEELVLQSFALAYIKLTPTNLVRAIDVMNIALEKEPANSIAHGFLAQHASFGRLFRAGDEAEMIDLARTHAGKSFVSGQAQSQVSSMACMTFHNLGDHATALKHGNRAVREDPDNNYGWGSRARALLGLGRYEEALADIDHTIAITTPNDFNYYDYRHIRGYILMGLSDFAAAEEAFEENMLVAPLEWNLRGLIVALAQQDKLAEAKQAVARYYSLFPNNGLAFIKETLRLQNYQPAYNQMILDGLQKAGMS